MLVLYADVVAVYQAIEATTSRLQITEVLVRLLRAAPAPVLPKLVYLTQGKLHPDFEVSCNGWRSAPLQQPRDRILRSFGNVSAGGAKGDARRDLETTSAQSRCNSPLTLARGRSWSRCPSQ